MIKSFSKYNEYYKSGDLNKASNVEYYKKINADDHPESILTDISKEAIDIVSNWAESKSLELNLTFIGAFQRLFFQSSDKNRFIFLTDVKTKNCFMTVVEMPDEWFYISIIGNIYYKCDQLDGLKMFLDDFDSLVKGSYLIYLNESFGNREY